MLRGISASSTSCRFHCTNSGSLVLGAQIAHSNEDYVKLALYWAYIHPTSRTHRSFTDPPLIDPTSIPHRPTPHRPYILLTFQDKLFVMIPTLNSEVVYHYHISIVFPPRPPPHFYCFPSPPPPPPPPHFNCFPSQSLSPHFYCFPSEIAPTF